MSETPSRVLVVEDDGLVCLLLEDLLAELGCDVVGPANTAENAELIASDQPFDFALLDVNLGHRTSYGTAEILRQRKIPFAFLTGHGVDRIREDMRGEPVLPKPIDIEELEQLLRQSLGARA
jgi:CheY-like chemotaxis protein